MSYEGYEEYLCAKGHYWCHNAHDPNGSNECAHCKLPAVSHNSVDDTNCEAWGKWELKELAPAKTHQCTCGHVHETEPTSFSLVMDKKGKPRRTRWNGKKTIPI